MSERAGSGRRFVGPALIIVISAAAVFALQYTTRVPDDVETFLAFASEVCEQDGLDAAYCDCVSAEATAVLDEERLSLAMRRMLIAGYQNSFGERAVAAVERAQGVCRGT